MADIDSKYRATKLWNEVLRNFRANLPLKTNRRQFRVFGDTFKANDALDWLHSYLLQRPEYKQATISRVQALQLLNKFYELGLFVEVKKEDKKIGGVKDDGVIYKFVEGSPTKFSRTPLALRNNLVHRSETFGGSSSNRPTTTTTPVARKLKAAVTPLNYRKLVGSPAVAIDLFSSAAENSQITQNNISYRMKGKESIYIELKKSPGGRLKARNRLSKAEREARDQEETEGDDNDKENCDPLGSSSSLTNLTRNFQMNVANVPAKVQLVKTVLNATEIDNIWRTITVTVLKEKLGTDLVVLPEGFDFDGTTIMWNAEKRDKHGITEPMHQSESLPEELKRPMRFLIKYPWSVQDSGGVVHISPMATFEEVVRVCNRKVPVLSLPQTQFLLQVLERADFIDIQGFDKGLAEREVVEEEEEVKFVSSPLQSVSSQSLDQAVNEILSSSLSPSSAENGMEPVGRPRLTSSSSSVVRYETNFENADPETRVVVAEKTTKSDRKRRKRETNDVETGNSAVNLWVPKTRTSYAIAAVVEKAPETNVGAQLGLSGASTYSSGSSPVEEAYYSARAENIQQYLPSVTEEEIQIQEMLPKRANVRPLPTISQQSQRQKLPPLDVVFETTETPPDRIEQIFAQLPGLKFSPALRRKIEEAKNGQEGVWSRTPGYPTSSSGATPTPRHTRRGTTALHNTNNVAAAVESGSFLDNPRFRGSFAAFTGRRNHPGSVGRVRASWAPHSTRNSVCFPYTPKSLLKFGSQDNLRSSLRNRTRSSFVGEGDTQTQNENTMFLTEEGENVGVEGMRLALLFLPPRTRIWLQSLLRFMWRVADNPHLPLLTPQQVLEDMIWNIVPGDCGIPVPKLSRLVSFLMNREEKCLFVRTPCLVDKVNQHIAQAEEAKVVPLPEGGVRYCDWVDRQKFEEEGRSLSQASVFSLLDAIVDNDKYSPRHKKRLLKSASLDSVFPKSHSAKRRIVTSLLNLKL